MIGGRLTASSRADGPKNRAAQETEAPVDDGRRRGDSRPCAGLAPAGSLETPLRTTADEVRDLDRRIEDAENTQKRLAREMDAAARLQTVPGIGLLTATALIGSVGEPCRFPSGRHLAAFLGLVPRESSSGDRRRLGAFQAGRRICATVVHSRGAIGPPGGVSEKAERPTPDLATGDPEAKGPKQGDGGTGEQSDANRPGGEAEGQALRGQTTRRDPLRM